MSWAGFKKVLDRAGTRVMHKSGKLDASSDYEYEESLIHLKKLVIRLMNALEQFMRGMDTFRLLQSDIFKTAEAFHEGGASGEIPQHDRSNEYSQAIKSFRDDSFEPVYGKLIRASLEGMILHVSSLHQLIGKEHRKRLDYDRLRFKLEKAKENTGKDADGFYRIMREHQEAKTIYEEISGQLRQELQLLSLLRLPIVDPIFETFIKMQALYFKQVHTKCSSQTLRFSVLNGSTDNCFDENVGRILSGMENLQGIFN